MMGVLKMDFRYNGIRRNLEMIFGNLKSNLRLSLCFNMDGLPIFTNSKHEFWPILANIYGIYFELKFIHYHYVIHL